MPNPDPIPARPDPLTDPANAPHAWGRFKRILRWMTFVSALAGGIAVAVLWNLNGPLPIHMAIATFLGVGLSILMAAALMGLIFLSSGSGHDEAVDRFEPED
jgi:hypothetical protein